MSVKYTQVLYQNDYAPKPNPTWVLFKILVATGFVLMLNLIWQYFTNPA